jgi:hypothetical protein
MDNPQRYTQDARYVFRVVNGVVWLGCDLAKTSAETREKLQGKAVNAGLLGSSAIDAPPVSDDVTHRYDAKAGKVDPFVKTKNQLSLSFIA